MGTHSLSLGYKGEVAQGKGPWRDGGWRGQAGESVSLGVAGCCSSIVFADTSPCQTKSDKKDAFISCVEDPNKEKGILKAKLVSRCCGAVENIEVQAVAGSARSLSYRRFAQVNGSPLAPSLKPADDLFAALGWCKALCTRGVEDNKHPHVFNQSRVSNTPVHLHRVKPGPDCTNVGRR